MKRFLFKIGCCVLLVGILSYPLDLFISKQLMKSHIFADAEMEVWNDIYKSNMNSDIVILGSSTAALHFNTKILEQSLGKKVYNLGAFGQLFHMQHYRYLQYARHNKQPDILILSLDLLSFEKSEHFYNDNQHLSHLLWNQQLKEHTKSFDNFSFYDFNIPLARYIHRTDALKEVFSITFNIADTHKLRYKGFVEYQPPNSREMLLKDLQMGSKKSLVDPDILAEFKQFIQQCKDKNIHLILVRSPEYYKGQEFTLNKKEIISLYGQIADEFNIPFFDYSNDSICFREDLFFGVRHMNKKGADLFTNDLLTKIKPLLGR